MRRWLITTLDGAQQQVFCECEPNRESGYDTTDFMFVHELEEFKDLTFYRYDPQLGWTEKLDSLKERAINILKQKREQSSLEFVAKDPHKNVVYNYKRLEAERGLTHKGPKTLTDFPFATAESKATGKTIDEVLESYSSANQLAINRLASLEAKYFKLLNQIKNAETVKDIPDVESLW